MNKVILKGRLTKNIELKQTQSADPKSYTMFSVAVNRYKEGVDFINCKAWGKTAEFLNSYFKKGQEIVIEGRIEVSVSDTDGVKTTFTNVVVERVEFCGYKSEQDTEQQANNETVSTFDEDNDLPF